MGNPKAIFATGVALFSATLIACGSDHAKTPDAAVVLIDAPIDSKAIDAPPDAPAYDFSCFGMANPTTADATITVSGTTTIGQTATQGVQVQTFKTGVAMALDTATSGANGAFMTGAIPTGTMPFDGYLKATYVDNSGMTPVTDRYTYLYPANPITTSVMGIPVPILDKQSLGLIEQVSSTQQDDTNNGMLVLAVTDCNNKPIAGATPSIKQNNTNEGTVFDPSTVQPQLAGTFIVFNVPDGATDVSATAMGMMLPAHTVQVHKQTAGQNGVPSVTVTQVRPGP
jgi:hypothetical protein